MAGRIYICPVVNFNIDGDVGRAPKPRIIIEPGRGKNYQYSAAIAGGSWCLCYVKATDFSALDADPECTDLFEALDLTPAMLDETPRSLGWSAAKQQRVRQRAIDVGVDVTGITADTTFEQILLRICRTVAPYFHPRRIRV